MSSLNKLPQVKSDLMRKDDNWEDWDMEAFIDALLKWLKRNKSEDRPGVSGILTRARDTGSRQKMTTRDREEKKERLFAFFARKIIGETAARPSTPWRLEGSS